MVRRAGGALLAALPVDRQGGQALGAQLYVALRDLILSGGLAPGARLPSSRTLAQDLGVSRTTVVGAYERLVSEGLIEARVGAGSHVAQVLQGDLPPTARPATPGLASPGPATPGPAVPPAPRLSRAAAAALKAATARDRLPGAPGAFVSGLPELDAFPMAQWARLSARHWRSQRSAVMGYGPPGGDPALRAAIAGHLRLNRGITCRAEQVFVTAGAQQAFRLIGSTILNPGDAVWFENPGALGARNALAASGARLVPVPVDADGLVVEAGLRQAPGFRLAFVTPSHQQPLGSVLSLERRLALLAAARAADAWVVEDDYDGEFFFGRQPLPTLQGIDRGGRVIYVGTFSKSLFPALRLGFMLLPEALVAPFSAVLAAAGPGVPAVTQAVVADFITEGHFATHIRRMRKLYAERHMVLRTEMEAALGDRLTLMPCASGLHTVALLPAGLDEGAVAAAAAARGLHTGPLAQYAIAPLDQQGLVLGFGCLRPSLIRRGVAGLAAALGDVAARGGHDRH